MKRLTQKVFLLLIYLLLTFPVIAEDYYISATGTGNGLSSSNPASLADLRAKLNSITSSSDRTLNVFWENGTYNITDYLTFPAATNTGGLSVTFMPLTPNNTDVRIMGASGIIRFIVIPTGTAANNMNLTIKGFTIQNFESTSTSTGTSGQHSVFTVGAYNTLNLDGVRIRYVNSTYNPLVTLSGSYANINAVNCDFFNIRCTTANSLLRTNNTYSNFYFENCVFDDWQTNNGYFYYKANTNSNFTLDKCMIKDCETSSAFFYFNYSGTDIISNCFFYGNSASSEFIYCNNTSVTGTFKNNSFVNNTATSIFRLASGTSSIYNNTFSSNTANRSILANTGNSTLLNNTIYNSGEVYVSSSSVIVRNNLVLGSSIINPSSNSNGNSASYNISDGRFYSESIPSGGTTGGVVINNLTNYWNPQLTQFDPENYDYSNPPMHELLELNFENHPVLKMGKSRGYESLLEYDQRGMKRPTKTDISIGAWDITTLVTSESKNIFLYDPDAGIESPGYIEIDLSKVITIPENITYDDLTITLSGNLTNGNLTKINDYTYEFRPNLSSDPNYIDEDAVGEKSTIEFTVEYTDNSSSVPYVFMSTNNLSVTIVDITSPLGMLDDSIYGCYAEFFPGDEFVADFKFITSSTENATNYYGFSIPLVGDLDGDGYPEIITLATNTTGAVSGGYYTHICILNGQTGNLIAKVSLTDLGIGAFTYSYSYHGSPCVLALVDSDRDGKTEIIIATTNRSSCNYPRRLISYEINENTFLSTDELDIGSTDRLTLKWISDRTYSFRSETNSSDNTNDVYAHPIPQIVDIDGDGNPEIVVYNKIFDAQTGELKVVFDDLYYTSTTSFGADNTPISTYKQYAYMGRNMMSGVANDKFINCYSVYDLDGDGKYEIIAGGKVYYDFNLTTGGWKVKCADDMGLEIGDGYTAVADINGDGKAEIVVVKTTAVYGTYYPINTRIQVWDPKFMKRNADDTGWEPEPDRTVVPEILAEIDIPVYASRGAAQGSLSFVYIGDIDGKVSENQYGEKVKLPEISILQGEFYSTNSHGNTDRKAAPIHPLVNKDDFPINQGTGYINYTTSANGNNTVGALGSWTWDENGTTPEERLKLSFILEHSDRSINTGFTFFDFDNDGCQDICYRDERTLRIISPRKAYISQGETDPEVIRFSYSMRSFTGFEYPVIADIDNDGSADMIVMGRSSGDLVNDYIYAVQADPNVSKFAPAPTVWNQFHYHPLKINEDLSTPYKNLHPLDSKLGYIKNATDENADDYLVKDYIFNNTTTQVPKFILKDVLVGEDPVEEWAIEWRAIMPIPDASFSSGTIDISNSRASFYIKNTGDAALNGKQLIAVYRDYIGAPDNSSSKTKGFLETFSISNSEDIRPGDSLLIIYPLAAADLYDKYIFRVLDASYVDGSGTFHNGFLDGESCPSSYFDCDWTNNEITLSTFAAVDDIRTVLQYETITIPVFENDLYPEIVCPNQELIFSELILPGGSEDYGNIEISGDKKSLIYTAPATYSGIVEIGYKLKCDGREDIGYVYIFIVESCSNSFAACYGNEYTVCLKEKSDEQTFKWYTDTTGTTETSEPGVITNLNSIRTFYAKPVYSEGRYSTFSFPVVPVVIRPISSNIENAQMKWTGEISTDWKNPYNWKILDNNNYIASNFAPSECVDVILEGGLERYPMITDSVSANNISIENRGMISGTQLLKYNEVSVKVNFDKNTERDRWVMYSAPLRKTYSGDFMLVDYSGINPKPIYRAVYMNFFQSANPDNPNSIATANAFTKPFGSVGELLKLGKPFNIWIDKDIDEDTPFAFPSPFPEYSYDIHGIWSKDPPGSNTGDSIQVLDRKENGIDVSGRFIIEDIPNDEWIEENAFFRLVTPDDDPSFELLMVPNPFMAYLDMESFLLRNQDQLAYGYKIWSGKDDDFVSYQLNESSWYDRIWIVDNPAAIIGNNPLTPQYVAPLQSFMVIKNDNVDLADLKFGPSMTRTTRPSEVSGDYELRNTIYSDPEGLVRITASSGDLSNSTVLINAPGAPNSFGYEDSRKIFYDYELSGYSVNEIKNSLMTYTLTPEHIPLAINMMGDFSEEIPLGIRLNFNGEVRFDFSNVEKFGYNLYLRDGNQLTDLQKNPVYTANIMRPASTNTLFYEVNDRFMLRVTNGSESIGERGHQEPVIRLTTQNGVLYINSTTDINSVEIYTIMGNIVYKNNTTSTQYEIERLERNKVYIVKMNTPVSQDIKKVIIK